MERLKVFKIPNGMGGITYQVQTPDGEWHLTDESDNYISQKKDEPISPAAEESSQYGLVGKRGRRSRKKCYGAKTSLYLEDDLFVMAKHYCADSRLTLTQLVNKSLRYYLKKEKKKNAKEEEQKGIETEE